ncbi:hypothetical protein JZ751_021120 [Albula glossodonta]|uniref:SCAN box domain-containing protein n=1 Tax=Albula glossodonta TaxID=121402 RepID=A0A8T2PL49_9TELE|nr:hypothetical protein JZ751_021120 [Albula glossodonta]
MDLAGKIPKGPLARLKDMFEKWVNRKLRTKEEIEELSIPGQYFKEENGGIRGNLRSQHRLRCPCRLPAYEGCCLKDRGAESATGSDVVDLVYEKKHRPVQDDRRRVKRATLAKFCTVLSEASLTLEHSGEFAETDKCCRVHDHCPYVIHPFSTKFGYTNFKWHSICHCDCDNACKQYDKIPVAVTKESIPYDFGGIDVIDELTIAPRTQKTPNNEQEGKTESTTQPTTSGSQANTPEAPSLGNVVTAAEDFIKVLATVSSSHSSTETTKGEAQGADKKKKSKAGKKRKNQRRKGKGKGKKRRRLITTASRTEETAAALPSCPGAELVMDRNSPVILDPKPNSSVNNYVDNVLDLGSREEIPSNVTNNKSERMVEVDGHSSTTAPLNGAVKTETTEQKPQVVENQTEQISLSLRASPSTDTQFKAQKKRSKERRGKKKNIKITPGLSTIAPTLSSIIKDKAQRMTDDRAGTTAAMATAEMKPTTGTRLSTQHFPFTPTTASARTVTPLKVKRHSRASLLSGLSTEVTISPIMLRIFSIPGSLLSPLLALLVPIMLHDSGEELTFDQASGSSAFPHKELPTAMRELQCHNIHPLRSQAISLQFPSSSSFSSPPPTGLSHSPHFPFAPTRSRSLASPQPRTLGSVTPRPSPSEEPQGMQRPRAARKAEQFSKCVSIPSAPMNVDDMALMPIHIQCVTLFFTLPQTQHD